MQLFTEKHHTNRFLANHGGPRLAFADGMFRLWGVVLTAKCWWAPLPPRMLFLWTPAIFARCAVVDT